MSVTVRTYAILNDSDKGTGITISGGGLTFASDGNQLSGCRANMSKSSGKWYWEVTVNTIGSPKLGILTGADNVNTYIGSSATGYAIDDVGQKWNNATQSGYGSSIATGGTVVGIALDLDGGTITYYVNGVSQGTAFTGITGTFYPGLSGGFAVSNFTINFGQNAFAQSVPSGYNSGVYTDKAVQNIVNTRLRPRAFAPGFAR